MNKQGGIKTAFFSIVAFSMLIIAIGVWVGDWNETYGSGLTYDLGDYNKLTDASDEAGSQQGDISVKSSTAGEDFEGTSIRGVFGLLNNIYSPFRVVFGEGGMIDSVTDRFGVPNYVRQGLITIMIFAITFALVKIFFRVPGDV